MNYRELQLRQQTKNQLAKLQQEWHQLENQYKGDILALQNSTDLKLLNQTQAHSEKLQKALDSIIAVLGKEEIKELKDIQKLLAGKTLKEVVETTHLYQQKINDLDNQLINLARQKIKNQKEAQELLNQLENNWKSDKSHWEQEKTNLITTYQQEQDRAASSLAQERKDFSEKTERLNQVNQELTTNLTEKGTTITNHLTTIKELEAEITNQKTNLKNLEQKNQAKIKEIEQQSQVKHNRIVELEKELEKNNQQIVELKQAGREVRELLKSTKNQLQEKDKELQTNQEQIEKATYQANQIKKLEKENNQIKEMIRELEKENFKDFKEWVNGLDSKELKKKLPSLYSDYEKRQIYYSGLNMPWSNFVDFFNKTKTSSLESLLWGISNSEIDKEIKELYKEWRKSKNITNHD